MFSVKTLIYKFERLMTAATFAQAGEQETAREIMREKPAAKRNRKTLNDRKRVHQRPVLRV